MQKKINSFFKPSMAAAAANPDRTHDTKENVNSISELGENRRNSSSARTLNKKRSYAQYHLEFGQSDFLLHECAECGLRYARGEEGDEKVHRAFHANYVRGIQFKGWLNEKVVSSASLGDDGGRIVLVEHGFSAAQRRKVQEVAKMVEAELSLSEGWLLHEQCKREVVKRAPVAEANDVDYSGAILCEESSVPAKCGVRAIWVISSSRRKRIATRLLDAARNSFCMDYVLQPSECAFSEPTSAGRAFAIKYYGTKSFLVYKAEDS
ncbi:hypothetical protein QJS04_geneDACA008590 [Acorus gramineus]|uniref:N-acetyltransferase ESCO2 n=1 Tax=Acorus gramineus TaxID=55184 RepID=A0AAV9AJS6_ACOGR|nr:hypothetical protein QJS04_geneDACA008590 [Acorus gramineus]